MNGKKESKEMLIRMPQIEIAGRLIGPDHSPYVIAELSANHNGKLETALRIIEEAQKAGAEWQQRSK